MARDMITINEFQELFNISEHLASLLMEQAEIKDVIEGTTIIKQGSEPTYIIFVADGVVAGIRDNYDGTERLSALITKGRIAGEAGLVEPIKYYSSFTAITDARLAMVEYDKAKCILSENREMLELVLRSQTSKLKYASMVHYVSIERDKLAKVAAIVEGISDFSELDEIPLSIEQLAGILGMSRNTVSQSLKQLEDRGAILLQKSNIVVLNKNKLSLDAYNSKLFQC